jgi:hypothetical protein
MHRNSTASTATLPPLDYLQVSPVRGQLEPSDETTKKTGWRFVQCTDTPNELKVGITTLSTSFLIRRTAGTFTSAHGSVVRQSAQSRDIRTRQKAHCILGTYPRNTAPQRSDD